jgi:hypothetical protein
MPLIVISPSIVALSPSRVSSPEKLTSGCRSASKNSGESRCVRRFSSFSRMLSMRAEPASLPSASVASKSSTVPVKDGVGNLEADAGVDGVGLPDAGRDLGLGLGDGAHVVCSPLLEYLIAQES